MDIKISIDDKPMDIKCMDKRKDFSEILKCLITSSVNPEPDWKTAKIEIKKY